MSDKVYNVESKRFITIHGQRYKDYIKKGYTVNHSQLLPPLKTIDTPVPSPSKIPEQKVFESTMLNTIVKELEPHDLLSLYLTNKDTAINLNHQTTLNYLTNRYHTQPVHTFQEFIKLYHLNQINPSHLWLYQLENKVEMPTQKYVDFLMKNNANHNQRLRAIVLDWMYDGLSQSFKSYIPSFGLTVSFYDLYCSQKEVDKDQLQLIVICCSYLAVTMMYDDWIEFDDYMTLSSDTYNIDQMQEQIVDIFNTLKGHLIRPFASLFMNQHDELITISYYIPQLIIYKPSMIVEAIRYLTTGQYKIYTSGELSFICKEIVKFVTNLSRSSLSIKKLVAHALKDIKFNCFENQSPFKESPFKYNNMWHVGDYEKISILGEGSYGKVKKIKQKQCGTEIVMKTNTNENQYTFIEISLLQHFNSPFIISLCGYEASWEKINLYLPLAQGTLTSLVNDNTLDQTKLTRYMKQMITGLKVCHDHDVIHRDIKDPNIVYDEMTDSFKLIDFGLAVTYASTRKSLMPHMAATIIYRAPEALLGDSQYTTKIDIWAMGVVFYFMILKQYPFTGDDESHMIYTIFRNLGLPTKETWPGVTLLPNWKQTKDVVPIDKKIKPVLQEKLGIYYPVIMSCFTLNPVDRPTADDVLIMLDQI